MIQKLNCVVLLLVIFTFCSCDDNDKTTTNSTTANFDITIGNGQPIKFTGTCAKVSDQTYQISGISNNEDLTIVIKWHGANPVGTFSWKNNNTNVDIGIWMAMATEDFKTQYYSYDFENGLLVDSNGFLKIEEFGSPNDFVEGTFTTDNAFLTEINGGTGTKTNVKVIGTFKIKREL